MRLRATWPPHADETGLKEIKKAMMRSIAFLLVFAAAVPAQPSLLPPATRFYHGSLAVGSINKGIEVNEFWGELELTNAGRHVQVVTVTVRRYDGSVILQADYTLAAGEKRAVRIEDPNMNVDVADGSMGPETLGSGVLIEPISPDITVVIRQLHLRDNQLQTVDIGHDAMRNACCRERSITHLFMRTDQRSSRFLLSNLAGQQRRVVLCESTSPQSCTGATSGINVPAYSVRFIPITETTLPYVLFVKPEEVIVTYYRLVEGTTSTFNAQSSITFGSTVETKKD